MNMTKAVGSYISDSKSIKDCLKNKLVNYSALSRQIMKEMKIKETNFDAVLVACRRYGDKLRKKKTFERQIRKLLRNSKLEIKNKVAVAVVEKGIFFNNLIELHKEVKRMNELFRIVEGINAITIITSQEFIGKIKKTFKQDIIRVTEDLVEVTLKSPEELESLPGVMSYLYSLFGEKEINIVETMSCWTDTIFVVEEKNLSKVMEVLSF